MPSKNRNQEKPPERVNRSVVLIGSSGGGTATLGHTQPSAFVETVETEFAKIGGRIHLREVIFVSLANGQGMDLAKDDHEASLFHLSKGSQTVRKGTLKAINDKVAELEESIANDIELGKVHGIISVSCKPSLFHQTLEAAASCAIPLTGTGGTSLSSISSNYRVKLIGNSGGSVATTSLTKAISFTDALAKEWGLPYRPWLTTSTNKPSWRSVLNSCLPAFWAIALCRRAFGHTKVEEWLPHSTLFLKVLQFNALPVICSVVMANSRRTSPGVLMGAALAAASCEGTVLGGLLAGWMVALLEEKLLYFCILYGNIPATMTNLLTTGFVGILVGVSMIPVAPFLAQLTDSFRWCLGVIVRQNHESDVLEHWRLLGMSLAGAAFCYGSKHGWYHSAFLPLILLEMELGDAAILGAMDQLTLVLVSAGICAGTLFASLFAWGNAVDVSFLKRGLFINLVCGDFVEACYPLMDQNIVVSMGGYLASSCSVALLSFGCKSSAYVPFPVAIWLADDVRLLAFASGVSFGISFLSAFLGSLKLPTTRTKE